MSNKSEGLRRKYNIERMGDPEKSRKHRSCFKFVLDPAHDPIARLALIQYMHLAREEGYQKLADDLHRALNPKEYLPVSPTYGLVVDSHGYASSNFGPWALEGDVFVSADTRRVNGDPEIAAWEVESFVPLTEDQIKILRGTHG